MSHKKDARLIWVKLQFDIKIFVLSIFEWPLKTGFTVLYTFECIVLVFL